MNKRYSLLALVATIVMLAFTLFFPTTISSKGACPPTKTGTLSDLNFVSVKTTKQGFPVTYNFKYKLTPEVDCPAYKDTVLPISFLGDLLIIAVPGLALAYLLSNQKESKND